jgi:hypothetical protein
MSTTFGMFGSLSGVVNDTNMKPIKGALVRVYFHETYEEDYTDCLGYYYVTDIPLCNCTKNCTASKKGYVTEWVNIGIGGNETYDFVLEREDSNLVEFTTEIYGLPGMKPQTVYLTQEDAEVVDRIFEEIKLQLDEIESREETVEIFNEAIIELDKYGLLGSLSVEHVQRLVTDRWEISKYVGFLERFYNRNHVEPDENSNCFIAGSAKDADIFGPFWIVREYIIPYKLLGFLWSFKILHLIVTNIFPWYLLAFISYGGKMEEPNDIFPSIGWIWTSGKNGTVQWNGSFYGCRRDMTFRGDLLEGNHYFVGTTGFFGLVLKAVGDHYLDLFHLGWALHVEITYEVPFDLDFRE